MERKWIVNFLRKIMEDGLVRFMVFNATFNNISVIFRSSVIFLLPLFISWQSVLLVKDTGQPGENHQHIASYQHTFSHNVVSSKHRHERGSNLQLSNEPRCTRSNTFC